MEEAAVMNSRANILEKLGRSLDGGQDKRSRRRAAAGRLAAPPQNLIPKRGLTADKDLAGQFQHWAENADATTHRVDRLADVPQAVAAYLARHNLPSRIKASNDEVLDAIDFSVNSALTVDRGSAEPEDETSLTAAFGGIAETGTLALISGEKAPSALNFLPPTNIVVLPVDRLAGNYEAVWNRLRGAIGDNPLPRTVNWITGPSRTGDIEQTLQLGIHGPKRLHIIIVDETDGRR